MNKTYLIAGLGVILLAGAAIAWSKNDAPPLVPSPETDSVGSGTVATDDTSRKMFSDAEIKLSFAYPAALGAATAETVRGDSSCTGASCVYTWVEFNPSKFNWDLLGGPDAQKEQERIVQLVKNGSILPENLHIAVRNGQAIKEGTELDKGWFIGKIKSANSPELDCKTTSLIYTYGVCSNITIGSHKVMRVDYTAPVGTVELSMDPGPADIEYYLYHPTLDAGMRITYASVASLLWESFSEQVDRKVEVRIADEVIRDIVSSLAFTN
ncbi:MAG: hypothetical protein WAV21_03380 [Minisyncoccia bacterium]